MDVGGVGFHVIIPNSTYDALGQCGEEVSIHTRLIHREDAMELYGFASTGERGMFDLLISVGGIGPKMGIKILDGMNVSELAEAIRARDYKLLTSIPGIGRKGAEKICIELETKVGKLPVAAVSGRTTGIGDAVDALAALGFPRNEASQAVQAVIEDSGSDRTEELVRKALSRMSGKK